MSSEHEFQRKIVPGLVTVAGHDVPAVSEAGAITIATDLEALSDPNSQVGDPLMRKWLLVLAANEYPYVEEPYQTIAINSIMAVRNMPDQDVHVLAYDLDEEVVENSQSKGYGSFLMRGPSLRESLADLRAPTDDGQFLTNEVIMSKFKPAVVVRLAQTRTAQALFLKGQTPEANIPLMNHVRNFTNLANVNQALTRKSFA